MISEYLLNHGAIRLTEFAKTLVVISHLEKAESLIIWGARTARVEGTELAVLCFTVGKEPQAVEAVSMEDNHEGEDILQAVKKSLQTVASEGLISSQITVDLPPIIGPPFKL